MKTKPSTEYVLLGALMSGRRHGYEILQFINTTLGSTWWVGTSPLYVLLKRLERDGILHSSIETQDTRPSKRVFSLKSEGKKLFLTGCAAPQSMFGISVLNSLQSSFFSITYLWMEVAN